MVTLSNELETFRAAARSLLAKLVGNVAATLFLADLEGNELVLHARHRKAKLRIKAWSAGGAFHATLAKPYRDERFVELAVRCLARLAQATKGAYRQLLDREHAGLERAMRDRLARRDQVRARERAARVKPPGFIGRLLRLVHIL